MKPVTHLFQLECDPVTGKCGTRKVILCHGFRYGDQKTGHEPKVTCNACLALMHAERP